MPEDLDLSTLRLLLAIDECGSLSQAAAARGISQPAASARIREFEAQWELGLVQRTPRGSTLTADGTLLAAWAQDLLRESDKARASLTALRTQRRCQLAVAASHTLAEHLVPRWLGQLRAELPELVPQVAVVTSEIVLHAVYAEAAEIGFVESVPLPRDLAQRVVGHDRLEIVVPPAHRWARRRWALGLTELQDARWVVRESGSGTRVSFETALRREPRVALEAPSTAALISATTSGVGPAVASVLSVRAELQSGRLVRVPHTLDLRRELTCVWQDGRRLSAAARRLLELATRRRLPQGMPDPAGDWA